MTLADSRLEANIISTVGITHSALHFLPNLRNLYFLSQVIGAAQNTVLDQINSDNLTEDGTVTYGFDEYMGYANYDGSSGNHFVADNAGLDWTLAVSMFVLVYFDTVASSEEYIMAKGGDAANQRGHQISRTATGKIEAMVSDNGANETTATGTTTVGAGAWTYVGMSYKPSTFLKVYTGYLGGTNNQLEIITNTTSIPATIFANAGKLILAAEETAGGEQNYLDGRIAVAVRGLSEWSDDIHTLIWKQLSPLLRIGV